MDWDQGNITSGPGFNQKNDETNQENENNNPLMDRLSIHNRFIHFLRTFREGNIYLYRDQLIANYRRKVYYLIINLNHLNIYDPMLQDIIQKNPTEYISLLESATKVILNQLLSNSYQDNHTISYLNDLNTNQNKENIKENENINLNQLNDIQIMLQSEQIPVPLRQIHSNKINRLIKIPGIIISASKIRAKAISMTIRCKTCGNTKKIPCLSAFGGANIPNKCARATDGGVLLNYNQQDDCGKDPYVIIPDKCVYVDQQTLKLQENPEVVPTGEMPRNILLSLDRYLVDKASPGTRISVIGITSIINSGKQMNGPGNIGIRTCYLKVVGIEIDEDGSGRAKVYFSPEEEEIFHQMARETQEINNEKKKNTMNKSTIYEKLAYSIAPSIYGDYTTNIKKAIACLLMGGSRKQLPDGTILRGDLNILLLGDPSTAKSQFLKFTEKVASVGVYTSGKGSSAAGLTASVIKDKNGEFYLEGGAMVLADGGVVCIDEFDKMRDTDRVAIHEAMEQQTISIAKAGITTILNARSSVLAAANPVYGRYDDMRSASENIDLMTTILSRFDMIFIIRDIQDDTRDRTIANHIISVHTSNAASTDTNNNIINNNDNNKDNNDTINKQENNGIEIEPKLMKKYITYCRNRCAPRLSKAGAQALQDFYVNIRDEMRQKNYENSQNNQNNHSDSAIPVTVRQLEALIRISESLAKMELQNEAKPEHVLEAIRLFRVSTMNAAKEGGSMEGYIFGGGFYDKAIEVENNINKLMRINDRFETHTLYSKLEALGYHSNVIQRSIRAMVQKGILKQTQQYKFVIKTK